MPKLLQWEYDPVLSSQFKPDQSGVTYIGKCVFTPPISINKNGFRGTDFDKDKKQILCLGSSEVLGTGVKDDECWPSILEKQLGQYTNNIQVINAGKLGFGPYHFRIVLDRYINKYNKPELVIIRLATGDMGFTAPTADQLRTEKNSFERNSKIKKVTLFLPFFLNKLTLQKKSILQVFTPKTNQPVLNSFEVADAADTFISRFKNDIIAIIQKCEEKQIPVILCVIDPISTPASTRLNQLLGDLIKANNLQNTYTLFIDSKEFNLSDLDLQERKIKTITTLRIAGDPHSNALQHNIVGEKLFNFIRSSHIL